MLPSSAVKEGGILPRVNGKSLREDGFAVNFRK
jgi:hypothetical protein